MRSATELPSRSGTVPHPEETSTQRVPRTRYQTSRFPPPPPPRIPERGFAIRRGTESGFWGPRGSSLSLENGTGMRISGQRETHIEYGAPSIAWHQQIPRWGPQQPEGLLHQLGNFVDAFSRFAQVLDMTSDATLWGSFPSLRWLLEALGRLKKEFFFIFQTYTLFKILRLITHRVGGLMQKIVSQNSKAKRPAHTSYRLHHVFGGSVSHQREGGVQILRKVVNSDKVKNTRRRGLWWILLLLSAIGGPLLINRLWRALMKKFFNSRRKKEFDTSGIEALALFDFEAQSMRELSFEEGDVIWVTSRPRTTVPAWWKGHLNGRSGLLPSNYVTVL